MIRQKSLGLVARIAPFESCRLPMIIKWDIHKGSESLVFLEKQLNVKRSSVMGLGVSLQII